MKSRKDAPKQSASIGVEAYQMLVQLRARCANQDTPGCGAVPTSSASQQIRVSFLFFTETTFGPADADEWFSG